MLSKIKKNIFFLLTNIAYELYSVVNNFLCSLKVKWHLIHSRVLPVRGLRGLWQNWVNSEELHWFFRWWYWRVEANKLGDLLALQILTERKNNQKLLFLRYLTTDSWSSLLRCILIPMKLNVFFSSVIYHLFSNFWTVNKSIIKT